MKPLFVLIALLSVHFSYEQTIYNIDSLKLSLKNVQADTSIVATLAELSFNYAFTRPDTAVLYGQQALTLAKKTGDQKSEAFAMLSYGWALWAFGDYDKAVDFALRSLQLFQQRKDYEMMVSANNALAVIFGDLKDYRMALGYSNAAKKLGDSLELFKKDVNSLADWSSTLTVRSTVFLLGGKLDSAEYCMKKVFSGYPISYFRGFPVTTMGRIAAAKKDYVKALYYFRSAIDTTYGNLADIMDNYVEIANVYLETGNIDSSIYSCKKVLQLGSNTFYKRAIKDAVYVLANCYKKKSMNDSEIKYLEMSIAMNDSLYSQAKMRSIQNLNLQSNLIKKKSRLRRCWKGNK
jgi:tetratricopeptide (TPR) repeat protein